MKEISENDYPLRIPAVAGRFYSENKEELQRNLESMFNKAKPASCKNVAAIIAPHAGFVYSGEVAASAYNQIDISKKYKNVFVLASSHQTTFDGASVYPGNYLTPMGEVKVNRRLAEKLIDDHDFFVYKPEVHETEHSLEVQLPFLQYLMKDSFSLVPIVIGASSAETCKKIAEALKPYFTEENLFVVSTDFSHYPEFSDAVRIDDVTAGAVISKKPAELLSVLKANAKEDIANLATSMCGWSSVLSLLYLVDQNSDFDMKKLHYANSGAVSGDTSGVVGYWAIALERRNSLSEKFEVSDSDKQTLIAIAKKSVHEYILNGSDYSWTKESYSGTLNEACGVFVSIYLNGKLRGCIGRFITSDPLYKTVAEMAVASAVRDTRFAPVSKSELDSLKFEISVLSPLSRIESMDQIELGRHGIYIKSGSRSGTFLPQVAVETGWSKEDFLGHCSRDKVGIGWDGWKDAELYIYTAVVFGEKK